MPRGSSFWLSLPFKTLVLQTSVKQDQVLQKLTIREPVLHAQISVITMPYTYVATLDQRRIYHLPL